MASQPTPEQLRLQMAALQQQMHLLQQQEQEAARQAALLTDSQSAQAATARTEQAEQHVVDTLNARIHYLESDLARLQQANTTILADLDRLQKANTEQAQEHTAVLADLPHMQDMAASVKDALHEVGADFAELVRTASALANNILEQNMRLTPLINGLGRHAAAHSRPLQDVSAARTAGLQPSQYPTLPTAH